MAGENFTTNNKQPESFRIFTNTDKTSDTNTCEKFNMKVDSYPHTVIEIEKNNNFAYASSSEKSDVQKNLRRYHYSRNGRNRLFLRRKKKKAKKGFEVSRSKSLAKFRSNRLHPHVDNPVRTVIDSTDLSGRQELSSQYVITEEEMYRQLDLLSRECVDLSRTRNKNVDGIPLLICIIMLIIAVLLVYLVIVEVRNAYTPTSSTNTNRPKMPTEKSPDQKFNEAMLAIISMSPSPVVASDSN